MRARRARPRSANARHHAEWLRLMDVSGPFLSLPVLDRVFPQEMDAHDPERSAELRRLYEDWQDERTDQDLHRAWALSVLTKTLELPAELIVRPETLPGGLEVLVAQHHATLRPDLVLVNPPGRTDAGKPRLLIKILSPEQDLEKPQRDAEWKASPATRMTELLRGAGSDGVRLGLVTNGERWMLVHAPRGEAAGYATWLADLWLAEPVTLRAFRSLLGVRRFFGVPDGETLEALYTASSQDQQDVTDRLGLQVRRAVTILVQAIDRIDKDRKRSLLTGFDEKQLYEAAVTTMMRLVFLLYAEEQGLLPVDDPFYGDNYAVSTLLEQLQAEEDMSVLERRHAAWNRLLATFRAVHGGIEHEAMRLPPYGGGLFDPDRFPFLEGRPRGSHWREAQAQPLPIDDATVLDLLASLQFLEVRGLSGEGTEAQRLSFKALGVEQIGHVYESLLDHTAVRATTAVVGLDGPEEPEIALDELEARRRNGKKEVVEYLAGATGKAARVAEKALEYEIPKGDAKWLGSCGNDPKLLDRIRPWAGLVREDHAGMPVVIEPGTVYVTKGSDRRSTGTHYTPPSLTEPIVRYTLEPLVYEGPDQGRPEEQWVLRLAREILGLRVCDMACGSGAFLVQACRYLSERLVEAWARAEVQTPGKVVVTPEGELSEARPSECIIPKDPAERLTVARRLVADRCLYGVDVSPMAVEMAKLSLWLVTLQKGRPFNFLDHAIKCGDSLLGVTDVRQIEDFTLTPGDQSLHLLLSEACRRALREAGSSRKRLEGVAILDIRNTVFKERLLREADDAVEALRAVGNLLIGLAMGETSRRQGDGRPSHEDIALLLREAFTEHPSMEVKQVRLDRLIAASQRLLHKSHDVKRRPFHWPLEFPEIFRIDSQKGRGFSAFLGNPPFMGGSFISGVFGVDYRDRLVQDVAKGRRGNADLGAYFLLRAACLLRQPGLMGFVATNTIGQGVTKRIGLAWLVGQGLSIVRVRPDFPWPGSANLRISVVICASGEWNGLRYLNSAVVEDISPSLTASTRNKWTPQQLRMNKGLAFKGSTVYGEGFVLDPTVAASLIRQRRSNRDVLFPYLSGDDITSAPNQGPTRWVIHFGRRSLREAEDYPECLAIVRQLVKPYREKVKSERTRVTWWLHERDRPELYAAVGRLSKFVVTPYTSKHWVFVFATAPVVVAGTTFALAVESSCIFGILQSSIHEMWLREGPSKGNDLAGRPQYSVSNGFETFPFPSDPREIGEAARAGRLRPELKKVAVAAEVLLQERAKRLEDKECALTELYNNFHTPAESSVDMCALRDVHITLDRAVLAAYGWVDLQVSHEFVQTRYGERFLLTDRVRREVLDRLVELNRELSRAERSAGANSERHRGEITTHRSGYGPLFHGIGDDAE